MTTWIELGDLVEETQSGGAYIPCRTASLAESAIWTSDAESDQVKAADRCYDCPLFQACRVAATEISVDEIYGALGGYTVRERIELDRMRSQKKEAL